MHSMGKTIAELHAMLKLHEKGAKGKGKGKNKLTYAPKPKIPSSPKRDNLTKDYVCHHCKEVGHWRRNYPSYQAELKKRKNASVDSTSGSRKLKHEALSMYMGNGMCAVIEAIGSFDLVLPSGLIIILDNYHFAPTITRGVVSISRLVNNGYIHTFTKYGISVSKDIVFYFNAIPRDAIYEIDIHNIYPNVSSMFNVSNKRAKHALDSSYLWHSCLGHINKKRMDKLQRDGILQPTHDESMYVALLELCQKRVLVTSSPLQMISAVMERRNRTLLDMVRSMMNLTTLPKSFWGYAIESAARILNMVPTKKVVRTPYEIWHGKAPKLSYLRVWGYEALVKQDTPDKLDPRSIKCIFVGYPKETMGYYFYYPLKNKIFVAQNAEFFENSLMVQEASESHRLIESSGSDGGLELNQEEDTQSFVNTSECFYMKELGEVAYILIIKIIRDRSTRLIALSQSAYLEKILNKFWMENSKKGYTPMIEKHDYKKSQGAKTPSEVQHMQRVPYASAIGSIMYAVRCIRPDVAFA
ncbi:retrotransposon protein, putative, ty1-copia subclass [Tanacetum coccineum]